MVDISVLISVVVALVAVASLVYTIFHFMYNEFKSVNTKISDLGSSLGQRLVAVEVAMAGIKEQYKTYVELLMKISKPNNPHPNKDTLLKKLYEGTITYEESTILQKILEDEKRSAEASNDFVKVLIIVGVLAFIAIVLAELSKKK